MAGARSRQACRWAPAARQRGPQSSLSLSHREPATPTAGFLQRDVWASSLQSTVVLQRLPLRSCIVKTRRTRTLRSSTALQRLLQRDPDDVQCGGLLQRDLDAPTSASSSPVATAAFPPSLGACNPPPCKACRWAPAARLQRDAKPAAGLLQRDAMSNRPDIDADVPAKPAAGRLQRDRRVTSKRSRWRMTAPCRPRAPCSATEGSRRKEVRRTILQRLPLGSCSATC